MDSEGADRTANYCRTSLIILLPISVSAPTPHDLLRVIFLLMIKQSVGIASVNAANTLIGSKVVWLIGWVKAIVGLLFLFPLLRLILV